MPRFHFIRWRLIAPSEQPRACNNSLCYNLPSVLLSLRVIKRIKPRLNQSDFNIKHESIIFILKAFMRKENIFTAITFTRTRADTRLIVQKWRRGSPFIFLNAGWERTVLILTYVIRLLSLTFQIFWKGHIVFMTSWL